MPALADPFPLPSSGLMLSGLRRQRAEPNDPDDIITYSFFDDGASFHTSLSKILPRTVKSLSLQQEAAVRDAVQLWREVADVKFVEQSDFGVVEDSTGNFLRFMNDRPADH